MNRPSRTLRARLHEIIFEADTPEGRLFDVVLMLAIVSSVMVVLLESVASVRAQAGPTLRALEWGFTILFTIEYILRLATVRRPLRYARSTLGILDLLAILPSYVSLVLPGGQSLLVIRLLRLLRIFRVLKLAEYLRESRTLSQALRASRRKIEVFLLSVVTIVVMLTGYGIIAAPTGIVTAELTRVGAAHPVSSQACPGSGLGAHEFDAVH